MHSNCVFHPQKCNSGQVIENVTFSILQPSFTHNMTRVRSDFSSWWGTWSGEDCFKVASHHLDIFTHILISPTSFYYAIRPETKSSGVTSKPLKFHELSGTVMDQIHQHVVFNLCQTLSVCLLCAVLNERSFQWLVLLSGWLQRCWEMNPTTRR